MSAMADIGLFFSYARAGPASHHRKWMISDI